MAEAESPDRESQFHELLVHVVGAGELFDRLLIAAGKNDPLDRDDMPAYLLFEVMHLTRLQFEAACHDLADPWLSYAAGSHLRPVIEGMGHIAFVLGRETEHPVGTSEQRAGCLALARAREAHKAMAEADRPETVPAGNVEAGREWVAFNEGVHSRLGCPFPESISDWPCTEPDGAPCKHRELWPCRRVRSPAPRLLTSPTMRRLSAKMSFPFRDLEQAWSLVLHQSLIDRMMVDTGRGTNAFRNATYKDRALTLAMGLSAYSQSLGWVMETNDVAAASVLRAYVGSTWSRPDIVAIMAGEWDDA
jgi:hypothetical protein